MIPREIRWLAVIVCLLVLSIAAVIVPAVAQDDPAGDASRAIRARIDAIRNDLVELRFEKALAAVEGMLGEPGMPETERAELLILRSQTHVAFGDLDAAGEDFRQILRVRPEYVPDASLTSKKAMDRFYKVQADLVGKLRVLLDPADARLVVGSRVIVLPSDGMLILLAGEHRLRAEREGFDPVEQTVEIAAAAESTLEMRLTPNSRSVVLRTEPDGVEVFLDGASVGVTQRPEGLYGSNPPPAELVIENVPLGDHDFELRKECFRDELLVDSLTVDLLQRTPKRYEPVALVPARSSLTLRGGPDGAEVFLDGKPSGRLPHDSFEICPGTREVELRFNERVIWRSAPELRESVDLGLEVDPRPNAAVVGAEVWPAGFEAFSSRFNTLAYLPRSGTSDLSQVSGWKDVELPRNTDLALGVVRATRQGARDKWYLYSPILRSVNELDVAPDAGERPAWYTPAWGLSAVDSKTGGAALVVEVFADGPAAATGLTPGDRVVSVGGLAVGGADGLRGALRAAKAGRPLEIEWRTSRGENKQGRLQGVASPLLIDGHDSEQQAMIAAAWAVVDSVCDPAGAASPLANLALLFSEFGHHDLSVETWRRIRWGARPGIGEGTSQYYLGRELERLGQEQDAVKAYTSAASGTATAHHDFGPRVAPAAADRLADLGVTPPKP